MRVTMRDPAGENREQEYLRSLGKWRFILARGIVGFGVPMSIWFALSNLRSNISDARLRHVSLTNFLWHSWVFGFVMCAALGSFVGLLAWRRITSDIWPSTQPDPDSSITRLGPLA
jgi:protein-S-isoprenylcysteine O-methyltransferase Ste14